VLNVSPSSITRAKAVLKSGDQDLIEAVERRRGACRNSLSRKGLKFSNPNIVFWGYIYTKFIRPMFVEPTALKPEVKLENRLQIASLCGIIIPLQNSLGATE
jgi:hypothetical protein